MSGRWYYSKVFVYIVIGLLGPLGLPLLWMSPRFTKKEKWILTTLVAVGTILLVILSNQISRILGTQMELIQQLSS